ncbi:MAG: alpha/beta fold hydrolase, partial [Oscillospiraceae bacterium]|nr:alpha/beta fold hydrolase [Oscillospiraceae bacterium]
FVSYLFADGIDDRYTFVCWDQRGAGRTYEHNKSIDADNDTVSLDRALADLDELVDKMCERYGQDKVIIMGHSYGSYLGARYVYDHPEKVSHYIGIGQVVDFADGEKQSYNDALTKAIAAGEDTSDMERAWGD